MAERCEGFDEWAEFIARPENRPEAVEEITGVPAAELRAAARLYATGGNAAIYYGLGVTEHSQGSTMVMGMANLAMATGNIGRDGVGVNPLRGQNNVQGSCDMGSFPHELPGYRHVSDDAVRERVRAAVGRRRCSTEPGLRIPNMFDAALDGTFRGLFVQGEDIAQSDPNIHARARRPRRHGPASSCRTCSSTRRPSSPTCSCRARRSSRRTAPSPTPSGASTGCGR